MSDDLVNFTVGPKVISHPPDNWDGSVEALLANSHQEDEPCEICSACFMSPPQAIWTVTKVDRATGRITVKEES